MHPSFDGTNHKVHGKRRKPECCQPLQVCGCRCTARIMSRLLVYRTTSKILLRLPRVCCCMGPTAVSFVNMVDVTMEITMGNGKRVFQRVEIVLLVGLRYQNVITCTTLAFSIPAPRVALLLSCDRLLFVAVLQAFHGLTQYRFCFQKVDVLRVGPQRDGRRNGHVRICLLIFGRFYIKGKGS